MGISTTVIGDVVGAKTRSVNKPAPGPKGSVPPGGNSKPSGGGNRSPFELAIGALTPSFWARFRDQDFTSQIRDSSIGVRHLVKQIAAATRSSVPTRTTHPGGAYFAATSSANWATQGQFYKGAVGLLNGASQYTILLSVRVLSSGTGDQAYFGVGTENTVVNGDNYLAHIKDDSAGDGTVDFRHRASGGDDTLTTSQTGRLDDGVNRLILIRGASGAQTFYTCKPGHLMLSEDTGTVGALNTLDRALLMNAQNNTTDNPSPGYVVDNAAIWDGTVLSVAQLTDLAEKWEAELGGYYPSMMQYDGSTGYYSKTGVTTSGNKVTAVARFKTGTFTGGAAKTIWWCDGPAGYRRSHGSVVASDHATSSIRNKFQFIAFNSAGSIACQIFSINTFADDAWHTVFVEYDGDAGTAVLYIDGVDEKSVSTLTAGTLDSGAGNVYVGSAIGTQLWSGGIGYIGMRDVGGLDYSDFGTGDSPAVIDEKTWTEWGAQPDVWSHTGQLDGAGNKGSLGAFTKNGTITMTTGGSP